MFVHCIYGPPYNYEESRVFNVAYFNNNFNRLQVGLCEFGKRPWQKNIVLMTDYTSNSSSTVCVFPTTATILHFTTLPMCRIFFTSQILGDFGSHVTSLNQGPFSLQGVRKRTLGTRLCVNGNSDNDVCLQKKINDTEPSKKKGMVW